MTFLIARNSFCCESGLCLSGPAFVVTFYRITQVIPDGIIRCYLRHLFKFIHDEIQHIFQRLFEVPILLFAIDRTQFHRKLQQFLMNNSDGFSILYLANDSAHGLPCRFVHVFVGNIFPNDYPFVCIHTKLLQTVIYHATIDSARSIRDRWVHRPGA